ncbi:MAG: hypothetical protein ACR2NW_04135 [Thermodesulfobacteriota bacterium]
MFKSKINSILIVIGLSILAMIILPIFWKSLPFEKELKTIIFYLTFIMISFVIIQINIKKWEILYRKGYNLIYKFIGYVSGGIAVLYFIKSIEWNLGRNDYYNYISIPEDLKQARIKIVIFFLIIWGIAKFLDIYLNRGHNKEIEEKIEN